MQRNSKIFFYNGPVMRISSDNNFIANGYLLVEDGAITDFGDWNGGQNNIPDGAEAIDLGGRLLMPGLINSHNHVAMTLFRGLGDDMALMDWLNNCIFPVEKNLTAEWVEWGTKLGCLEMIRSGTTMVNDMYLYMDKAVEVYVESGMRAAVGEGVFDFPSPSLGAPDAAIASIAELIEKWKGYELISPMMVAHSAYTCSGELLKKVKKIADEHGVRLHIHLAESAHEVDIVCKAQQMRPIEYVDSLGLIDESLLAAHMVHPSDEEIKLFAERGGHVLHCPESNMKLSSGFAPIAKYLGYGVNVALGTDGCASNNNLDMFREMSFAAKIQKGYSGDPVKVGCEDVLQMATINGAKAFGLEEVTGSIELGKSADLIIVDFSAAHMRPVYSYASHLVYAASGADVTHTMVAGRWLMKEREILVFNEDEIFEKINDISGRIKAIID